MRSRPHDRSLRGPRGHGRHRARRGAVAHSILTLLEEQPMHGYDLMNALEERSGGRWRPSAGSIYPALNRLEERGFVVAESADGKKRYTLTDTGREHLADVRSRSDREPWEQLGTERHGEMRRAIGELTGPARQIARYGTAEQAAAAVAAIKAATATLYRVLADGVSTSDADDTPDTDSSPD